MNNLEVALKAAEILNNKKARDIVILDISKSSGFADFFVIATAGNQRQLKALTGEVEKGLFENDCAVRRIEGKETSGWVLMDYGDIIINLFTEDQRHHYQIEKIWNDCPTIEHPYKDI